MIKRNLFRRLGMLTALSGLLLAAGCDAPAGDEPAADVEQGVAAEPGAAEPGAEGKSREHHRRGKHGKRGKHGRFGKRGAPGLLGAALHKLTLTDAQKTKIESLVEGLKGDKAAHAEAHKAFRESLAEGVESGKIDPAVVDTHLSAMDGKMGDKRAKMTSALNELHATLTPEQRTELADAMRAKMDRFKDRSGPGPDFDDADDAAGADDGDGPPAAERRRGRRGGPLGKHGKMARRGKMGKRGKVTRLLRRLDLSEEQREQLREARKANRAERPSPEQMKAKHEARRAKMSAMLDAFASDKFDAAEHEPGADKRDMMRKHLEAEVSGLNTALPILTAEQRTKLAELLRQSPRRGKRGRRGAPGN